MYEMTLNEPDADDLTQDVFLRVYRNLSKFRGDAKFSTWLYRIAVNTANSFLRRKSKSPVKAVDTLSETATSLGDRPDSALETAEMDREVAEALGSLPVKLRSAIILTAIEGMDYDEAARVEGCPKATLYWRVHKARQILKEKLKEYL